MRACDFDKYASFKMHLELRCVFSATRRNRGEHKAAASLYE